MTINNGSGIRKIQPVVEKRVALYNLRLKLQAPSSKLDNGPWSM